MELRPFFPKVFEFFDSLQTKSYAPQLYHTCFQVLLKALATLKNFAELVEHRTRIAGLEFTLLERECIVFELRSLEKQTREALNSKPAVMEAKTAWKEFSKLPDIKIALWHAEISAFSQIYFAYENFFFQFAKHYWNMECADIKEVGKLIAKKLGKPVLLDIYEDKYVTFARLVRNSITHHGAYLTPQLADYREWLVVDKDELISISPDQTTKLYNYLNRKIFTFLEVNEKNMAS